ncbi:helix-turn-helix domain-containing protein [Rhodovulum sulfidophilum]|uniref:Helix-turn-helix domain-containing protein n=2 Tax=Rhodovulum sulfidophilum TaxID=35806 RepID=A0ABS1RXN3_RHOSU|nr:helix-turn-helix domain-containing protein [Rhodovulum sulfidophilum]
MITVSMPHTVNPAHERLKMELRLRGKSIASVARELEVPRSTVTLVSQGLRRSSKIEKALADAVGTTPAELFPDRYPAEESSAARKT